MGIPNSEQSERGNVGEGGMKIDKNAIKRMSDDRLVEFYTQAIQDIDTTKHAEASKIMELVREVFASWDEIGELRAELNKPVMTLVKAKVLQKLGPSMKPAFQFVESDVVISSGVAFDALESAYEEIEVLKRTIDKQWEDSP